MWRAAASFDAARSQPLTWLAGIARNRAIDSLRRAQGQPQLLPVALEPRHVLELWSVPPEGRRVRWG